MLINFCGDLTNLIEALPLTYLVLFSKHNNRIGEAKLAIGFIINHWPRPKTQVSVKIKYTNIEKKNIKSTSFTMNSSPSTWKEKNDFTL